MWQVYLVAYIKCDCLFLSYFAVWTKWKIGSRLIFIRSRVGGGGVIQFVLARHCVTPQTFRLAFRGQLARDRDELLLVRAFKFPIT